jgi:protein-tyrosine-phosphatase
MEALKNPHIWFICEQNQDRSPFAKWLFESMLTDEVTVKSAGLSADIFPSTTTYPAMYKMGLKPTEGQLPQGIWDVMDQVVPMAELVTFTHRQARELREGMFRQRNGVSRISTYGEWAGEDRIQVRSPIARLEKKSPSYDETIDATVACFTEIQNLAPWVIKNMVISGVLAPEHIKDPKIIEGLPDQVPEPETTPYQHPARRFLGSLPLAAFNRFRR